MKTMEIYVHLKLILKGLGKRLKPPFAYNEAHK